MRVLLASAELSPLVSTGGLGDAVAGLTKALGRRDDLDVDVVIPDYFGWELSDEHVAELRVPGWAGWARVRSGVHPDVGPLHVVEVPAIEREHPYVDPTTGTGWFDNDRRFFAFSAAVASLANTLHADVVHLNDWHTSAALALFDDPPPSVLTIHNLAYQGNAPVGWLDVLGPHADRFHRYDHTIPLAGGIALADRVVTVSPNYANEITTPEGGMGLDGDLVARGSDLVGILNGIDTDVWDPRSDDALVTNFTAGKLSDRRANTADLRSYLQLDESDGPLLGIVTRYTHQKGIDRVLALGPYLERMDAQMLVLGSGDPDMARAAEHVAAAYPGRVVAINAFDPRLSRRIFGSLDLYLMPSRFEPCGLAQMQAMRYGAIPVVTDVGGLHDTVLDADTNVATGTGFVATTNDELGWLDAVHRAVRAWTAKGRRTTIQKAGMRHDWSWDDPAERHVGLYREVVDR